MMRFDMRGIDRHSTLGAVMAGRDFEHAESVPAVEALVNRRARAERGGTIVPADADAQHTDDAGITRRSSTRRAPRRPCGKSGSIRAHSAPINQVNAPAISVPDNT